MTPQHDFDHLNGVNWQFVITNTLKITVHKHYNQIFTGSKAYYT